MLLKASDSNDTNMEACDASIVGSGLHLQATLSPSRAGCSPTIEPGQRGPLATMTPICLQAGHTTFAPT